MIKITLIFLFFTFIVHPQNYVVNYYGKTTCSNSSQFEYVQISTSCTIQATGSLKTTCDPATRFVAGYQQSTDCTGPQYFSSSVAFTSCSAAYGLNTCQKDIDITGAIIKSYSDSQCNQSQPFVYVVLVNQCFSSAYFIGYYTKYSCSSSDILQENVYTDNKCTNVFIGNNNVSSKTCGYANGKYGQNILVSCNGRYSTIISPTTSTKTSTINNTSSLLRSSNFILFVVLFFLMGY